MTRTERNREIDRINRQVSLKQLAERLTPPQEALLLGSALGHLGYGGRGAVARRLADHGLCETPTYKPPLKLVVTLKGMRVATMLASSSRDLHAIVDRILQMLRQERDEDDLRAAQWRPLPGKMHWVADNADGIYHLRHPRHPNVNFGILERSRCRAGWWWTVWIGESDACGREASFADAREQASKAAVMAASGVFVGEDDESEDG